MADAIASPALDGDDSRRAQAAEFLTALFAPSEIFEVRCIHSAKADEKGNKLVKSTWATLTDLQVLIDKAVASNENGWNVYVGVNPRRGHGRRGDKSVVHAKLLFGDLDNTDLADAVRRWTEAGLPDPSIVNLSGHGVHLFWLLIEPVVDLNFWTRLQKAVAAVLRSDPSVSNPERIARVPGFTNWKAPTAESVLVECHPDRRYRLEKLLTVLTPHLPPEPAEVNGVAPGGNGSPSSDPEARAAEMNSLIERAVREAKVGRRNSRGFQLARELRDVGVSEAEAQAALASYQGRVSQDEHPYTPAEATASVRQAFRRPRRPPPSRPFPINAPPEPIRQYVREVAASVGCDVADAALPMLAALAAAVGGTRCVLLKADWAEPCIVWGVIVGRSGTRKSVALEKSVLFLHAHDLTARQAFEAAISQHETDLVGYEMELLLWRQNRRKGVTQQPPTKPTLKALVVDSVTIEKVAEFLTDNPRGVLVCRDELRGWFREFDAYRNGRGGDMERWASIHGGRSFRLDRKTGERRSITIARAVASVAGCIPTGVLGKVLTADFFDSGFCARVLFTMSEDQRRVWSDRVVDPSTKVSVKAIFDQLLQLDFAPGTNGEPVDLPLTPEAKATFVEYYDRLGGKMAGLSDHLAALWSKLEGYAPRLALVIHLVRQVVCDPSLKDPNQLDHDSMRVGIELAEWFGDQARRVYAKVGAIRAGGRRQSLVDVVRGKGGTISARDLARNCGSRFPTSDEAEEALDDLVRAGLGRWEESKPGPNGGRPTKTFALAERARLPPEDIETDDAPSAAPSNTDDPPGPSNGSPSSSGEVSSELSVSSGGSPSEITSPGAVPPVGADTTSLPETPKPPPSGTTNGGDAGEVDF